MDFFTISILIALFLSVIAGLWDLFTTEVPDEIPLLIAVSGIFFIYISGSMPMLFGSLIIGTIVLAIGYLLYKKGHWGGADAFMLAAISYAIPILNARIFIFDFIPNLLIVGTAYIVIYAIFLGIKYKYIWNFYVKDLKKNYKYVIGIPAMFLAFILLLIFMTVGYMPVDYMPLFKIFGLIVFVTLFWRYGKVIENRIFRREVSPSELKAGDVLENMIWRGLTEEEVKKLRRTKKKYIVKEGVRFVPAFPLALAITILYGNLLLLII